MGEDFCSQHHLVEEHHQMLGEIKADVKTSIRNQESSFKLIGDLKALAAQNATNINNLTKALNGMGKVQDTHITEYEKDQHREEDKLPGFAGWLNRAWDSFSEKFGWICIALILWMLLKAFIFKEMPFPAFK